MRGTVNPNAEDKREPLCKDSTSSYYYPCIILLNVKVYHPYLQSMKDDLRECARQVIHMSVDEVGQVDLHSL